MLDIALLREKPDWVKGQLAKLYDDAALARVDRILALDAQRREGRTRTESAQAARKQLNRAMGKLRGNKSMPATEKSLRAGAASEAIAVGDYAAASALLDGSGALPAQAPRSEGDPFAALITELRQMAAGIEAGFRDAEAIEAQLRGQMLWLPNLPHESVPVFASEEENRAQAARGSFREFDFSPKPHWELARELDIIDFERGVKLAGSRYYLLKGQGAQLQRALINFFLDCARANGYCELYTPLIVHGEMLYGAAQFPKFIDTVYQLAEGEKYLLPTAEVAITNLYRDEIVEESALPMRFVAHSPCFRSEKASAGRDVRGIKRVHQFEKVELYQFTRPEDSYATLEAMTAQAEALCAQLDIPYRRLEIVSGDLGFSASKKYDIEMWSPGCAEWLEVSSCSNTEAFQARRAMLRYYPAGTRKTRYLHTLNGSGLATPRVIIAILENNQQADGTVLLPEVLGPYMGGMERIG